MNDQPEKNPTFDGRSATDAAAAGMQKALDAQRVIGESRMIRTETLTEEITEAQCQAVRDAVKAYLAEKKLSQAVLKKALMESSTTISQVLSGTYKADPRPHIRDMDRWLERRQAADAQPSHQTKFIWTSVANRIRLAANLAIANAAAHLDKRIALVFGAAGCGKTYALEALAESMDGLIITCGHDLRTPRAIIDAIAEEIGLSDLSRNMAIATREVVKKLKGSGKLIIVDEIQALLDGRDDSAFHTLRRISDVTECPQLWCATCDLMTILEGRKHKGHVREPLAQIYTRFAAQFDLTEKISGTDEDGGQGESLTSTEEVLKMFGANEIKLSRDGGKFLARICTNPELGLFRTCTGLVAYCTTAYRGKVREITPQMLWEAACFLYQKSFRAKIAATVKEELRELKLKIA